MIGWRVWDVMRTLDYIATRPELDSSRVGCMGISGGGTVTRFRDGARAAHPRRAGERLPEHVPRQHRQPRALHRQLRARDSELGRDARHRRPHRAAAAVRRVGREGQHLPDRASIESFNEVREIYGVFGAADRVEQEVFPGEHSFWGKRGIPFLARHLSA